MNDVVIAAHEKDVETLIPAIKSIKKNVIDLRNVYVISDKKLTDDAIWIPESEFSFNIKDVSNIVGTNRRTCWYYAMLLKVLVGNEIKEISDKYITMCSDTFIIKPTKFFDGNISLHNISNDSNPPNNPYCEHLTRLIPEFKFANHHSGIVHHGVVQKDILNFIINKVELIHKKPFWQACLDVAVPPYKTNSNPIQIPEGCGKIADYEILFHYPMHFFPERSKIRILKHVMAYKENLGVEGYNSYSNVGSRINLGGHVKIFEGRDSNFKFSNLRESFNFICDAAANLGWDMITFQNHTRIGSDGNKIAMMGTLHERINRQ